MNNDATKEPTSKPLDIFPPSIGDLKGATGKRADKKINKLVRPPIMPKALQKKNESAELIERIKS